MHSPRHVTRKSNKNLSVAYDFTNKFNLQMHDGHVLKFLGLLWALVHMYIHDVWRLLSFVTLVCIEWFSHSHLPLWVWMISMIILVYECNNNE